MFRRSSHGVEGSNPLGFSIRLENVNILCSTSCFLIPILYNSFLILVWPASRCSTQGHCQSETNKCCVICQQTASHQLRDSQLRELTKNLDSSGSSLLSTSSSSLFPDNITMFHKYLGFSCMQMKNNVKYRPNSIH